MLFDSKTQKLGIIERKGDPILEIVSISLYHIWIGPLQDFLGKIPEFSH